MIPERIEIEARVASILACPSHVLGPAHRLPAGWAHGNDVDRELLELIEVDRYSSFDPPGVSTPVLHLSPPSPGGGSRGREI